MQKVILRKWRLICAAIIGSLVLLYLGLGLVIGHQVGNAVSEAVAIASGDPVSALLFVVNSSDSSIREKNRAVWALGQLGNPRALDTLQSQINGQSCDHSSQICQYTLKKAIGLCEGEQNIGAYIWRHGNLAIE